MRRRAGRLLLLSNRGAALQDGERHHQHTTDHGDTAADVRAAQTLRLSYRQVRRLMVRFRRQGAAGLVSRRRSQVGNQKSMQKSRCNAYPGLIATLDPNRERVCEITELP